MPIQATTAEKRRCIGLAILAAALYALNAPFSKLLLCDVHPLMMASFLYLGAGLGMLLLTCMPRSAKKGGVFHGFQKKDRPYLLGTVILDIVAPIFLMLGLRQTTAANASLLNNFEIVATSLIALLLFQERINRQLWLAIGLITASSALLSFEGATSLHFSPGSFLVLLAAISWGFENNCTRMLSQGDPREIVILKGIGSGLGALLVAVLSGAPFPALSSVPAVLFLGFVSYGLILFLN